MIIEDSASESQTPRLINLLQELASESASCPWHPWPPATAVVFYSIVLP
jgi:hypothetical protein